METAGSAKWTIDNIKTLLKTMNESIANRERGKIWSAGLKTLDWQVVAFKNFTAEECCAKWKEIMQKLRKIKTLAELIADAQSAIDDSDSKIKLIEDPETKLPKRPLPANAFYFAENKKKLIKRNPGISSQDLMKLANDRYKKLPSKDMVKYLQKAAEAKEQYKTTMDKWRSLHPPDLKKPERKKIKKDAENNKVKVQPIKKSRLNGYNLFCREQKSHLTGIPQKEITSIWSKRWKRLSQEERDHYSRRCKEIKITQRAPNKPCFLSEPKRPTSSMCGLYCKEKMAEMKGKVKNQRKLFADFSQQFKTLSKQERERYQAEIDNNYRIYKDQLQKWFKTLTPKQQVAYCQNNPSKLKYLQSKRPASRYRTSDSEDDDLEDSSSDDDDLAVIEIGNEIEEDDEKMFDLF